jgi:aminotransferase
MEDVASSLKSMVSDKTALFTESVIRMMTQRCNRYQAINLSQGTPAFPTPEKVKKAAIQAIEDGYNQYSITWGAPQFRQAIAEKMVSFNGIPTEPDLHVTVACGATEAMMSTMLAIINPGDEVVILEPFYENYGPDVIVSGAKPVYVPLREMSASNGATIFAYDSDELRGAFSSRTKAIILNNPNNPLGKVFTVEEIEEIAALCCEYDCLAVTDEMYEYLVYDGQAHISIGSLPEMWNRTITISGLSKTYSVTGWRLGYVVAPEHLTNAIRKMHDFLTVGAPHPLQIAGAVALRLEDVYYQQLVDWYNHRRQLLLSLLEDAGFQCYRPQGAYYIMTDISRFGFPNDTEFALWLVKEVGVGGVPGSSFYSQLELGRTKFRFMFSKPEPVLLEAGQRLMSIREKI